jgi:LPPG:FO 2-phospho-L-lactate transferase
MVETAEYGVLEFQEYFVRYRWQPVVKRLWYEGAGEAKPAPGVIEALTAAEAIVICPSNPVLSVEPILQVPGLRAALARRQAPCVAVSPIIAGAAVKGPAVKIMNELHLEATAGGVAAYYGALIDGFVLDTQDRATVIQQQRLATNIRMNTVADRERLAREVLVWIGSLA